MNTHVSMKQRVLDYIDEYGSITTAEGFTQLGTSKLTTLVSTLRREGHHIIGTRIAAKNRWGQTVYFNKYTRGE